MMGNGPAAIVANNMRRSFLIKLGLMVGVGGDVWRKKVDIRLGDVIVSQPTGMAGWCSGILERQKRLANFSGLAHLISPR